MKAWLLPAIVGVVAAALYHSSVATAEAPTNPLELAAVAGGVALAAHYVLK